MKKKITENEVELELTVLGVIAILSFPPLGILVAFLSVFIYLLIGIARPMKLRSFSFRVPSSWMIAIFLSFLLAIVIEFVFIIIINPFLEKRLASQIDLSAYSYIRVNVFKYLGLLLVG